MKRGKGKKLSDEDRILWNTVAASATPLKPKAKDWSKGLEWQTEAAALISTPASVSSSTEDAGSSAERFAAELERAQTAKRPVAVMAAPRQVIDRPTATKLAKGRVQIDGKIDLHGLTQSEAHSMLLGFLHQAYAHGRRHVLVVTGKGASFGSEGVLKRAVPAWFATAPFRVLVGGYHDAARHHGGSGALYVRLRRKG